MDLRNLYAQAVDLATDPKYTRRLAPLLQIADSCLCALIIWKVPYTEIDWRAYMQQVTQYLGGERDYTLIKGGTGPLVYPAGHVYIYSGLHRLTGGGEDVFLAQMMFGGLYLGVLGVVMGCYRRARTVLMLLCLGQAPPYLFPLLVLSKRLHSLFVLRLFNDCFAVGALWVTIYAYQKRMWTVGSVAYSLGVGVKMSLLLALPAVGVVLLQAMPAQRAMRSALLMAQVQVTLAFPFLPVNAVGYVSRAFEFTRQFLFKWTVNWRFVGEEMFLSKGFSIGLGVANLSLLGLFAITRWIRPSGLSIPGLIRTLFKPLPLSKQKEIQQNITTSFIMTTILGSVAVGMLCARSLHYQFYAYVAWSSPFLLWKSGLHPVVIYAVWMAQEWAWNVYPSTIISSIVVVMCLTIEVAGLWWGTGDKLKNVASTQDQGNGAPASKAKIR